MIQQFSAAVGTPMRVPVYLRLADYMDAAEIKLTGE
jgi:hypothetical protein